MKSGMQKTDCRELTDVELNAVSGGSARYGTPPQATFMSTENQNAIAIARSHEHELSAIYIANHP